jgi:hypothetical protein
VATKAAGISKEPTRMTSREKAIDQRVSLYRRRGETTIHIEARITETGAVEVSGQDIGKAPQEFWGDDDYEYGVTIAADQKDRLVLALLEALYHDNPHAVEDVKQLLTKNDIPYLFDSWV